MALYRAILSLIDNGRTVGLAEKIDIFFLGSRISETQYSELTARLSESKNM